MYIEVIVVFTLVTWLVSVYIVIVPILLYMVYDLLNCTDMKMWLTEHELLR